MPTPYEPAAAHPRPVTDGPDAGAGVGSSPYQQDQRPPRPPLVRSSSRGWTPGVCGAVARHLGVSRRSVRWVFVLLTLVGGAGIAAYVFLWALTPEGDVDSDPTQPPGHETPPERRQWGRCSPSVACSSCSARCCSPRCSAGRSSARCWCRCSRSPSAPSSPGPTSTTPSARGGSARARAATAGCGWRWASGLTVAGILVLVTRGESISAVWDALLAAVAVLVGALIIAAPWALRLWSDLRREQVAAARATERADIAAHLHDSVLQTLALIQRQSDDRPRSPGSPAPRSESCARGCTPGRRARSRRLAAAVTEVAHDVEDLHGVPIDLVVTGDRPLRARTAPRSPRRCARPCSNAVRHGGTPVTAYVEIGPTGVEAFVRDRGAGFDLDAVPADRLGVRQSILGRMERHGGTARVRRRDDGHRGGAAAATDRRRRRHEHTRRPAEAWCTGPGAGRPRRRPPDVPHGCARRADRCDGRERRAGCEIVGEAPDVDTAIAVDPGRAARRRAARRAPSRRHRSRRRRRHPRLRRRRARGPGHRSASSPCRCRTPPRTSSP